MVTYPEKHATAREAYPEQGNLTTLHLQHDLSDARTLCTGAAMSRSASARNCNQILDVWTKSLRDKFDGTMLPSDFGAKVQAIVDVHPSGEIMYRVARHFPPQFEQHNPSTTTQRR